MRHLYHTLCAVYRLTLDMSRGTPIQTWQKLDDYIDPFCAEPGEMRCRIDLQFQRPGKDMPQPVVAGRAPDRVGLMFMDPTELILSGDRFKCLEGPIQGIFEIKAMPDPAAGYSLAHHMEVQIIEVAQNFQPNLLDPVAD